MCLWVSLCEMWIALALANWKIPIFFQFLPLYCWTALHNNSSCTQRSLINRFLKKFSTRIMTIFKSNKEEGWTLACSSENLSSLPPLSYHCTQHKLWTLQVWNPHPKMSIDRSTPWICRRDSTNDVIYQSFYSDFKLSHAHGVHGWFHVLLIVGHTWWSIQMDHTQGPPPWITPNPWVCTHCS